MWRTRAAGRLSPRVMHDLQVTAECFVHALPKVRVAKKTIERTTIPCTRRARHDTHTMATGSLGEGVPVVRRRLSYYIKYSVLRPHLRIRIKNELMMMTESTSCILLEQEREQRGAKSQGERKESL